MLPDKLAFVDLETTGARSQYDRILEVGIVRVEQNLVTKTFHSLLNPLSHIPPEIERLTGITATDIADAPVFSEVKDEILSLLDGCVFVAHNVRFDYGFLKGELKREGIDFTSKHFCTVRLSRELFPDQKRHNLDSIIERHGIPCESRHRAFDDAKAIASFYELARQQVPAPIFEHAVTKAMKKPSVPLLLEKKELEELPEHPGVYIFFGENNLPLYIGKSINIKERVLSHFASDIRNSVEMRISQQIQRIETITTAGELGALFLESRLIKERLPLYNRQLRRKQQLVALTINTDSNGYEVLGTETVAEITPERLHGFSPPSEDAGKHLPRIIGFFKSIKQSKDFLSTIARDYELCEKKLGLEKTDAACFGYRLDRCKGACLGKEKSIFYNARQLQALHALKIKPWPFPGPIMIEEKNEFAEKYECFFVDKWCFMGSTDSVSSWENLRDKSLVFDLDMYKILRRHLAKPSNIRSVKTIPSDMMQNLFSPELGVTIW